MRVDAFDHVRPTDADLPDGVYRVVGTGDPVALLRVGDADGRRVNAGEVVTVDRDALDGFAPADNPDGSRSLGAVLASRAETVYWSLRAFAGSLAAHPVPTAAALAAVLLGRFGGAVLPIPDVARGGLIAAGALALAYVGSGRL